MRLSVCPIFLLTCEHDIKHDLWTRYCEHVTSPNKWTDFSDSWHKCSTVNFGGQDVKEQGHARPRIDLGAWRRHHSWPSWVELAFLVIPSPDWPADALCSRVVRLSVGVFVRLSVKNCEYDILKTDEPILMQTGISGAQTQKVNFGIRKRSTWGQKVIGQGHTRLKIYLDAWVRCHSEPNGIAFLFFVAVVIILSSCWSSQLLVHVAMCQSAAVSNQAINKAGLSFWRGRRSALKADTLKYSFYCASAHWRSILI